MIEKVKVSRELANAIETIQGAFDLDAIARIHAGGKWSSEDLLILNELSMKELMTLIVVGYEIEETPEEILLKNYKGARVPLGYYNNFNSGVRFAIDTLGIKIKGINK